MSNFKKNLQTTEQLSPIDGFNLPFNALILIFIACLLAYMNTLGNPFVFDDWHTIVQNPFITSFKEVPGFFFISPQDAAKLEHSGWRPLWYTSFAINYYFGGLNPVGYHIVNIAIHFINSVIIYFTALFLTKGRSKKPWLAALLASLFFCLHPLDTESVSYIVSRSGLLATLFYLLSFYLYLSSKHRKKYNFVRNSPSACRFLQSHF